jgi:CRISPR-associated protein Cas1
VVAKVANSRTVLQRAVRDHPGNAGIRDVEDAAGRLGMVIRDLEEPTELDTVRGREGEAARCYYSVFDHLITVPGDDFRFTERSRRPPLDNINALLSFLYTLLMRDTTSAVQTVGLDPQVGFLHRDRPGRPGLALDLMEEARSFLADRLALSLVNRQQIGASGFQRTESGAVLMDDQTRKEVIVAYQKRKQDEIQHPFLGEKVQVGLLPFVQALLLARYLRGDLDGYPPFFWR